MTYACRPAWPFTSGTEFWQAADVRFIEETASGKDAKRPGLEAAREALASGDAGALVVAKMDRLSRSLLDFTRKGLGVLARPEAANRWRC